MLIYLLFGTMVTLACAIESDEEKQKFGLTDWLFGITMWPTVITGFIIAIMKSVGKKKISTLKLNK